MEGVYVVIFGSDDVLEIFLSHEIVLIPSLLSLYWGSLRVRLLRRRSEAYSGYSGIRVERVEVERYIMWGKDKKKLIEESYHI